MRRNGLLTSLVLLLAAGVASPRQDDVQAAWDTVFGLMERVESGEATPREGQALFYQAMALAGPTGDASGADEESVQMLFDFARAGARVAGLPDQEADAELWRAQHAMVHQTGRMEEVLRAALAEIEGATYNEIMLRALLVKCLCFESRWDEAQEAYERLEQRAEVLDRGDEPERYRALWNQARGVRWGTGGFLMRGLGLIDRASLYYEEEARHAERSGLADPIAQNWIHRMDVYLRTERFAKVLEEVEAARDSDWYGELSDRTKVMVLEVEGIALAELEREDSARDRSAMEVLTGVIESPGSDLMQRFNARLKLAELELEDGRLGSARAHLEICRRAHDELVTGGTAAMSSHRAILASHLLRLALAEGGSEEILETARARIESSYEALLAQWATTPHRPGGIGFLHDSDRRQVVSSAIRSVLECSAEGSPDDRRLRVERAFDLLLRAEAMGSMARHLEAPRVSLEDVRRRLLAPGHGVLYYLPARDRAHLFALDRGGAWHYDLPSTDDLRLATNELARVLGRRPESVLARWETHLEELDAASRRVGEALLPRELLPRLRGWERLSLLGLGLLGQPRLELAPLGAVEDGTERMGARLAVDTLPSLTLGVALAERPKPSGRSLLLLERIDPGKAQAERYQVGPIAYGEQDDELLMRGMRHVSVERLHGAEVTLARLRRLDFSRHGVSHWILHGAHDASRERGAGLLIEPAGDHSGFLSADDVEANLAVQGLVILSACGAGQGRSRYGDDQLTHLGGAFLGAGAGAVLLSRTRIDYEATLELMARVHRALAGGLSPAGALRRIRAEQAARGDLLGSFYLTQFEVVGSGQDPVMEGE